MVSYKIHIVHAQKLWYFLRKRSLLNSGSGYCCPLSCEALLSDFATLTSASFFVMKKLKSESEVKSWHPMGHAWSAHISLWLIGDFGETFNLMMPLGTVHRPPVCHIPFHCLLWYTWFSSLEARESSGKQTMGHLKLVSEEFHQDFLGSQDDKYK